jgi:P27 family predicted phage terminase small subunit
MFLVYCEAYATWVKAKGVVARKGFTFETEGGQVKKRPEVAIMHDAARIMRQSAAEFGLTPSSRSRVTPAMGNQPSLPMPLPEQRDPSKPEPPTIGGGEELWNDEQFFGRPN